MRVFVTGASGFVGSAIVQQLLQAGHQVTGLARSERSAEAIRAAGAEVLNGELEDVETLKKGAMDADSVIHTGFIHDFNNYAAAAEIDRLAIEAFGAALAGTDKPLVVTGGIALAKPSGALITEQDLSPAQPRASEAAAIALSEQGIRASVVRLPPSVHDRNDHGFIPTIIRIAKEKGVSGYIGEGANRWPAVHRLDAARLYRLAIEKSAKGALYNVIGDEGIEIREIARVIGQRLGLPVQSIAQEDAAAHFGWMARFIGINCPASAEQTKEALGWQPTHPGLLDDLLHAGYLD